MYEDITKKNDKRGYFNFEIGAFEVFVPGVYSISIPRGLDEEDLCASIRHIIKRIIINGLGVEVDVTSLVSEDLLTFNVTNAEETKSQEEN